MPPLYLLHPIAVHFPITLLIVGFLAQVFWLITQKDWLTPASSWLLWLGTATAWVAVGLGLLAAKTVPHIPAAWETMYDHKQFALWTASVFTVLSIARIFLKNRFAVIFTIAWLLALGLLFETADHGGDLVYGFGVAVKS